MREWMSSCHKKIIKRNNQTLAALLQSSRTKKTTHSKAMDKGLVISQNNKMMTSKLRRNSKAKTSKLIVALQKDQSQRCCATVPHDSSSSSACSFAIDAKDSQDDSIPLLPPHQGTPLSDSDQHFLEGLLVLAPDSIDALQVLMNPYTCLWSSLCPGRWRSDYHPKV